MYENYKIANLKAHEEYREYNDCVPSYLQNRPGWLVNHIVKGNMAKANDVNVNYDNAKG